MLHCYFPGSLVLILGPDIHLVELALRNKVY